MPDNAQQQPILIIDDNENDILLAKHTFEKAGLKHPIYSVSSGFEAITYLQGDYPYCDRSAYPLPELVLLDIRIPPPNGLEILRWIRHQSDPKVANVPVVMLTGDGGMKDRSLAYAFGANSFLVKPLDFQNANALSLSMGRLSL